VVPKRGKRGREEKKKGGKKGGVWKEGKEELPTSVDG